LHEYKAPPVRRPPRELSEPKHEIPSLNLDRNPEHQIMEESVVLSDADDFAYMQHQVTDPHDSTSKKPANWNLKKRDKYRVYAKMIPSFTNERRRRLYFSESNRGFGYINWDIEEELYRFQQDIEKRFKKSAVNKNFRFPRRQNSKKSLTKNRSKENLTRGTPAIALRPKEASSRTRSPEFNTKISQASSAAVAKGPFPKKGNPTISIQAKTRQAYK